MVWFQNRIKEEYKNSGKIELPAEQEKFSDVDFRFVYP